MPNAALWRWRGPAGLAELVDAVLGAGDGPRIDITLDVGARARRDGVARLPVPELGVGLRGPAFEAAAAAAGGAGLAGASLLGLAAPYVAAAVRWAERGRGWGGAGAPDGVTVVRTYGPDGDLVADVMVLAARRRRALAGGAATARPL